MCTQLRALCLGICAADAGCRCFFFSCCCRCCCFVDVVLLVWKFSNVNVRFLFIFLNYNYTRISSGTQRTIFESGADDAYLYLYRIFIHANDEVSGSVSPLSLGLTHTHARTGFVVWRIRSNSFSLSLSLPLSLVLCLFCCEPKHTEYESSEIVILLLNYFLDFSLLPSLWLSGERHAPR